MTVAQILQRSSNVGAVTIAETKLGETGLLKWIHQFGFGQQTGIDFPGESAGLLPTYWSGSTIGNVPIGQGISVTAIQLASVYAAIANGGLWVQPHLVDHVQGERAPTPRTRRIVCRGVDRELLTMLKGVVSDAGTGTAAEIPGYTVAGKTGTAQKPGPHGYIPGEYVATFVGMVPASNAAPRRPRHRRRAAAAPSTAASSPRPRSRRSPRSTSSTSRFLPTSRSTRPGRSRRPRPGRDVVTTWSLPLASPGTGKLVSR